MARGQQKLQSQQKAAEKRNKEKKSQVNYNKIDVARYRLNLFSYVERNFWSLDVLNLFKANNTFLTEKVSFLDSLNWSKPFT